VRAVILAVALLAAATSVRSEELTIDRIFGGGSLNGPAPVKLKISPDGARVSFLRAKADDQSTFDLWEYNVRAGKTRLLVDSNTLSSAGEQLSDAEKARRERARIAGRHGIVDYNWAPDGNKLLFPVGEKLYLYDLTARPGKALRELATGGEAIDAQISPKGRFVSYLREQNIWLIDLHDGRARALTHDGGGSIHAGEAEFVAQEEMDRFHGYWWAPDDSAIAFERFDESAVAQVKRFEVYADRSEVIEQRYPAAGGANVAVRLGLIAPGGGEPRWVDLGGEADIYLARVDWLPDSKQLSYQLMSRNQQRLDLRFVDTASLTQRSVLSETSATWINLDNDLHFLKRRDAFVWGSDRSGDHHLYLYKNDGTLEHAISSGEWNVDGVLAIDERAGLVYVDSNRDFVPDRQLYALKLDGSAADSPRRLSTGDGLHTLEFSRDAQIYADSYADPATPPQVSLHRADGRFIDWIERNPLDASHPYAWFRDAHIVPEFGTLASADGQQLYYRIFKPAHFDATHRYPVFDTYYGGPHGQVVTRGWGDFFAEYMAQHGYVVFSLDNRGMGRRGRRFTDGIYKQLGKLEVEDQLAGIRWLNAQSWIDPDRIGVFGWSYGGYMTAMLLAKAPDQVAAGVAVAPVVEWNLYDTFYTERYLDAPQRNADGYALSGVLHWIDGIGSGRLLLVHVMADDNVQFTNSTMLMSALQQRGTQFELMTYPGAKHGLSTPWMRKHVYHAIADFFDTHVRDRKVDNSTK